mgnify:CR=1 FL=1
MSDEMKPCRQSEDGIWCEEHSAKIRLAEIFFCDKTPDPGKPAPSAELSEEEKARTAWIEKMTGMKGACLKCGGQKRVSTAAIKLPETYHDCESCGGTGYARIPFADESASKTFEWMIEPLGVDGWQRFCYEYNSRLLSSTPPDPSSAAKDLVVVAAKRWRMTATSEGCYNSDDNILRRAVDSLAALGQEKNGGTNV